MTHAKTSTISPLDPAAAAPFYRQIYDRFRTAIASGLLKPGDRIPSARALTKELGLARGTIEAAYSLLAAEGYIEARGQAGTIVTPASNRKRLFQARCPSPIAALLPLVFVRIPFCRFKWACLPWMRFLERSGRGWVRGVCVPCSHLTWSTPQYTACRYYAPRSPHISKFRVVLPARHLRYS